MLDPSCRRHAGAPVGPVPVEAHFPEWAARGVRARRHPPQHRRRRPIEHLDGQKALARSDLKRTWALSQRLRDGADSPVDYVNAVEAYLGGDGFTYTEAPPAKARTLEGFLFDAKTGYCQQYSGAMALLLRMGGIPARVATGFTSGSLDRRAKEYVVRDLDAHSWVEAWFPGYGWVTFDPTPSAAPAALAERRPRRGPAAATRPDLGGGGALDPRAGTAADRRPAVGALHRRRRARRAAAGRRRRSRSVRRGRRAAAPLLELERALRRTRRGPGPGATLQALEASFARSPDAAGYVRALREQRYSGRGGAPTSAQRRGLRARAGPRRRAARAPAGVVGAAAEASRAPRAAYNSIAAWLTCTTSSSAGRSCSRPATSTRRRSRSRRPATSIPEKASIREALGRAYFRSRQFEAARAEFEALVERAPTNDYALFCLGRSLLELGRPKDARKALALAAGLRPDRRDYRIYRDRARAAA